MKKSIVTFIIGLLVGAIIATGAFYVYTRSAHGSQAPSSSMGEPPQQSSDGSDTNQPPEKPDGDSSEQPPEKPDDSSASASQTEG